MAEEELTNKKYRNWVKGVLALRVLKEGITNTIDDNCRIQHAGFISNISRQQGGTISGCDECSLSTLLPLHCKNKRVQCSQAEIRKCNCMLGKNGKPCPTNFCSSMYDEITKCHQAGSSPTWMNTNIHEWHKNHWEVAKCYISADTYNHVSRPTDTDLAGLLSILVNNMEMQNAFDLPLNDVVPKIIKFRNETLHSSSMKLNESELEEHITYMADILGDKKQMASRTDAQDALRKLVSLKHDDYIITLESEAHVRKAAMLALEERGRMIQSYLEKQRQIPWEISADSASLLRVKTVNYKLQTDYQEMKKELQLQLVSLYKQYYTKSDILPNVSEEENGFTTWYIKPDIISERTGNEKETTNTVVKSFRDIFYSGEKKNKNIYILGDAGVGKTSFCKHLVSSWCKKLDDSHAYEKSCTNDDEAIINEFEFLFFISLRQVQESRHVHDMVANDLLHGHNSKIIEEILNAGSEECLIILDGLDEWVTRNSGANSKYRQMQNERIPQVGSVQRCTVLTTTRPWKMEDVRLKESEYDVRFRILGFSDEAVNIFVERMVSTLNAQVAHGRHPAEFKKIIRGGHLASLKYIPELLLQLICLWYEDKLFRNSICEIYSNMLELMLKIATSRRMPLKQNPEVNSSVKNLPTCFDTTVCCQSHKDILLKLGAVALHTMCYMHMNTSTKQFSKREMLKFLTPEEIYWCLTIGVLTETMSKRRPHLTQVRSDVSFIHKSFQEFLAAVYLWTEKDFQTAKKQIPECNPVRCIFDMNSFFVFVSGMNPFLGLYLLEELKDGTHCTCSHHEEKLLNIKIACKEEIKAARSV